MRQRWIHRIPLFVLTILLILGMVWAFCYLIGDLNQRQITYNVTEKVIDGDPTLHGQIYEVMIMPGVDEEVVRDALKQVSNQFGFVIVPYDPARVYPSPWLNFDYAPFPREDESYLIVLVPREDYPNIPAAGWTVMGTGRVTVLVDENYPSTLLAGVIEHECTHNIEDENKLDYPKNTVYRLQFNGWLGKTWLGSEAGLSENAWSIIRTKWEISEYLDANEAGYAEATSGA